MVGEKLYLEDLERGREFYFERKVNEGAANMCLAAVCQHYLIHLAQDVQEIYGTVLPPHILAMILADVAMGHRHHATLSAVTYKVLHYQPIIFGKSRSVLLNIKEEILETSLVKTQEGQVDPTLGLVTSRQIVFISGREVARASAKNRIKRRPH